MVNAKAIFILIFLTVNKIFAFEVSSYTFNTGLLDNEVYEVPDYHQRLSYVSSEINNLISGNDSDLVVFFTQETWHKDAYKTMRKNIKLNSISQIYEQKTGEQLQHDTGLDIFINLKSENIKDVKFYPFLNTAGEPIKAEVDDQLNAKRGLIVVEVSLNKKSILLINTQLTPLVENNDFRLQQILSAKNIISKYKFDMLIFGGDFNFSPFFEFLPHEEIDGNKLMWSENGQNYFLFSRELKLQDSLTKSANDKHFLIQNRSLNDLARVSPSAMLEPDQRSSYIWLGLKNGTHCKSLNSKLIFNEPIKNNGDIVFSKVDSKRKLFLSDHFGFMSQIKCN